MKLRYLKSILQSRSSLLPSYCSKEVISCKSVDLLYDQVLKTDLEVGANRPDLVIKDKVAKKTYILDVSCPCDVNIYKAEATKVAKYIGL